MHNSLILMPAYSTI